MKRQTELAILAALILFMAFTPGFAPVRTLLSTPVGKLVGLLVVVYVFKFVSPAIGLLLAIHVARCSGLREGVDETLSEPVEMCECPPEFTYNSGKKMCEKGGADDIKPTKCACMAGEVWDDVAKKCGVKAVESAAPVAPTPEAQGAPTGAAELAAVQQAAAALPASSVPETTGSAAGAAMASAAPPAGKVPEGFAQREKFTPMESMMTLGKQYSPW